MGGVVPVSDLPANLRVGDPVPAHDLPDPAPRTLGTAKPDITGGVLAGLSGPYGGTASLIAKDPAGAIEGMGKATPYAAALVGPEGFAAGTAVQGIAGAAEEFAVQTAQKLRGERQSYDWPAMGWSAGWNAVANVIGHGVGKGLSMLTGAGKLADQAPKVNEMVARGDTVTPATVGKAAQAASDEVKTKTMLDSLGQRLGMTEEQSKALSSSYDEGRKVADSVFKTDRFVQKEFDGRYDAILGKYKNTPVDATPVMKSVQDSLAWVQQTGNAGHIRPQLLDQLQHIGIGKTDEEILQESGWTKRQFDEFTPAEQASAVKLNVAEHPELRPPTTVATLRGWQSELRAMERTKNLTDVEKSVIGNTEKALNRTISDAIGKADPKAAEALKGVDADYGVFKSNFRTFWKALKEKKSLSEVGDAIYNQMGKRPDALRYMLQAADRAGRMDDMREAFVNKIWRESEAAGGPINRAQALASYVSKFAPGAKGADVLQMVLGKQPGITDSVGTFTQRIADMSKAQEAIKDPAFANRTRRMIQYRILFGALAGGGLSYSAFHKDPVQALTIGLGIMAGAEGLIAVAKNPALNRAWVQWITTNPAAPEFIQRGARLVAQATKEGILPAGQQNAQQ